MTRITALLLSVVAAALFLAGGLTVSWWTQPLASGESSIGLREARLCNAGTCVQASLGRIEPSDAWFRMGAATYAAALLSAGLLLGVAIVMVVRRGALLMAATSLVAVISAAVAGVMFVWTTPDYQAMSAGYSLYSYFAGAIVGVFAALLARRVARSWT